jgi:hypothetical protein
VFSFSSKILYSLLYFPRLHFKLIYDLNLVFCVLSFSRVASSCVLYFSCVASSYY